MKLRRRLQALTLAAALTITAAACGDDATVAGDGAVGNPTDHAFAAEMIVHHESAVEMAEIAMDRAQRRQIKQLANSIASSQRAEIRRLRTIKDRLERDGVEKGDLGMSDHAMAAAMDADALAKERPFDRAFIDAMIPHHQGAIRMARVEQRNGEDPALRHLADAIIREQSKEIDQLNEWRVSWYGPLSRVGGVPDNSEQPSDAGHGDHGG